MSEEFESCTNCIHSADAESLCILRLCKHAIAETKECYEPKVQPTIEPKKGKRMRLIDADALIEELNNSHFPGAPYVDAGISIAIGKVLDALTIELKKGMWIDYSDEGFVECPFCHSATNCDGNKEELHFCFSCGASMEEGEDG